MSEALPRRSYLDPRSQDEAQREPIADSVNIPLSDLAMRAAELPAKNEVISVAGPEPLAVQTIERLNVNGRKAEVSRGWSYGENFGAGRLWEPNGWLKECLLKLEPQRAVDLGCGSGRDAVYMAALGWHVTAIDVLPDAVELGRRLAARYLDPQAQKRIDWLVADILDPQFAPPAKFDLVFSAFFFDRTLVSRAIQWLNPGGSLISEAFTSTHQAKYGKPTSPLRVVNPGEMADLLKELQIVDLYEGERAGRDTARAWALKTER